MTNFGIEKAAADIAALLLGEMRDDSALAETRVSPIEALFATTFHFYGRLFANWYNYTEVAYGGDPESKQLESGAWTNVLAIDKQVWVIDWPVDFVVSVLNEYDDKIHRLAIECDGHEFHERTKEQAARDRARDRALQAAGYTVMRFTGSEIYRDPVKCVQEVWTWAGSKTIGWGNAA